MYTILDFKAVTKHSYYGCDDPEGVFCEVAGRRFAGWKAAANSWLDRYIVPALETSGRRNLLVAHDMGREFRKAIFPEYKANRDKREVSPIEKENLDQFYTWAKKFLSALGATQIGVKGVEADDVIAWLCQGIIGPKAVYTVDGDLVQLANDQTAVYLKEAAYYGEGTYHEIPFHLTSICKSITGDSSDNYPGIKGIGEKKVLGLIEAYGVDGMEQLQEIVESGDPTLLQQAVEETGDKVLAKILDNFGEWRTQWRLAKLHPELCWRPRAKKLVRPEIHKRLPNPDYLYRLLKEVGAEDMWETTFEAMMPSKLAITAENWEEYREGILSEMSAGDLVAFDYETSDKEPIEAFQVASASGKNFVDMLSHQLAGASFCFGEHSENIIYLPVDHKDSPNLPKSAVAELVEHAGKVSRRCAHNAMFEGVISQTNLGLELTGVHDTRIMQRYYNENDEAGLKAMALHYLGYEQATYEETLSAGNGGQGVSNMSELTLEEVFSYGCDDAQVTASLYDLMKLMLQLDGQWTFYEEWAVDPTVVMQHSYIHGVDINWQLQKQLHERDLETVENGTKQLREILEANVTGEVTAGCQSFIEAEKDYIYRAAKKKADGDAEAASTKVFEWKTKQERACQYLPLKVETVMPKFAFTANQLTDSAVAVGLPPVEKVAQSYLGEYLAEHGMVGFGGNQPEDPGQLEFLTTLRDALEAGAHKVKALETALAKAEEAGDDKKIRAAESSFARATEAYNNCAEVFQRLAGVKPKEIRSGDELNVGSPQQMQQLLYCKIGVPVRLRGKTPGKGRLMVGIKDAGPSTDESAIMHALANDIEKDSWQEQALKTLLQVKSASTRISLYHDKYPLWKHRDGKIHPMFTDAGTDTRRPTGSSPNVLQVSKKDKAMRSQFVPPGKDYVCVAIDYNGQELRLLACESGDPVMIDAYNPEDEKDLHSVTGSGIAALKATKAVSAEERANLQAISDFIEFNAARNDEDHPLNKLADAIRKHAKGCIAEGSLVLTDSGLVPIEKITTNHKVWDGIEFVSHDGLDYRGVQEVITVGPLTATHDHEVYLHDGTSTQFGAYAAQQDRPALAVGEVAGAAVGYLASGERPLEGVRGAQRSGDGHDNLLKVSGDKGQSGEQPAEGSGQAVQVPAQEVADRGAQGVVGAVPLDGSTLHQSQQPVVQELRSEGDNSGVSNLGRVRSVDAGEPTAQELQGSGDRPQGQQQGVHARKPQTGAVSPEPMQYTEEPLRELPRGQGCEGALVGFDQDGSPGVSLRPEDSAQVSAERNAAGADTNVPAPTPRWAKVYDLINAGPRHRFTVSGVVVGNCNFGLAYGAAAPTLSRNLVVPVEEADELLSGAMTLYARIPQWQQETAKFMEKNGFTLTAFGTKRHATDDVFSKDRGKVSRQHRQGANATIQGTAAEMLRIVLTGIVRRNLLHRLDMVFFAPIYDETVAWVHKKDVIEYCREMGEIMSSATPPSHPVPQVPEFSIGPDWGRVHELGRNPSDEAITAAVERSLAEAEQMWEQMEEAA